VISPLAIPAERFGRSMFSSRRQRDKNLYGITLHTTGSGLPKATAKTSDATLKKGVEIYTRTGGPHYVIGWDGTIVATVADERIRGAHAGITDADARSRYRRGGWESRVSAEGSKLWHQRWPGKSSPVDLIPTKDLNDINDFWIGIEMIPVTPGGKTFWARPAYPGSRFTAAQHASARRLAQDIARRHNFSSGWQSEASTRLLGHSDLNPIGRDTRSLPLWDPGYHTGMFDMGRVRASGLGVILGVAAAVGLGLLAAKYVFR
jgi:N-acetyl-anhydromuramyl-L-alanine amidase AmpD